MYPGKYLSQNLDKPAFVMAESGEAVTYGEYEARSNKLAWLLRDQGMKRNDHYAIFMENNRYYPEALCAGERTGLYFTTINSYLTAEEVAYIVNNSESKILITSQARREVALAALEMCPDVHLCVIVDGPGESETVVSLDDVVASFPNTPVADESMGTAMLYSSGTTGKPKGILRPVANVEPETILPRTQFLLDLWEYREGMVYLSPAPIYHAAPYASISLTLRMGGTVIIMEKFDAEAYLALVQKYRVTHSQLVPTMFSRMLKMPDDVRLAYDISSLETIIHAAAPCPVQVKEQMIDWWGPIIHEYYGASEGLGFTACNSEDWLTHKGTVGKLIQGDMYILDDDMQPSPRGTPGGVWFKVEDDFEYFNDPERTAESRSADGVYCTVGDVGYLDDDNFLFLTDRSTFMIVSGGVNIYPQECENLLITHPKIADAAVFGVPNEEMGEEVKAVVQVMPGQEPGEELANELIAWCRENLSHQKCPRSVDFEDELPRLPTGKLYKRVLKDRYWQSKESRIL